MTPLSVHVLVLGDCTSLVPVGFADLLRKSAELATALPGARPRRELRVQLVSAGRERTVVGAGGIRVACQLTLRAVKRSDLVLVPALDPDVLQHLALHCEVVPWLRRLFLAGADVASACTGAFLLAEAGLLHNKAATTHWAFQDLFRQRYPDTRLEPQAVVVDQGRVITAGGASSFLTLSLYLVERLLGASVARAASRMFLVDVNKSPQGAYAIFAAQREHGDPDVLRAQDLIERELRRVPSMQQLARQVGMSRRNFVRRFKLATGNTPREYVQRVRVEAAKRALERADRGVAGVARDVGYQDLVAFRRIFVRTTGLTPADYRARYGARTPPGLVLAAGRRARSTA